MCSLETFSSLSVKRTDPSSLFSPGDSQERSLLGGGCDDEYLGNSLVAAVLLQAAEIARFQTHPSQEDALSHVLICLEEHSLQLLLQVT